MEKVKYFDTQKIVTDGFSNTVDASLCTELVDIHFNCNFISYPKNNYLNIFQACQTSAPMRIQTSRSIGTNTTAVILDPFASNCLLQFIFPFYSPLTARVRRFSNISLIFPGLKQATASLHELGAIPHCVFWNYSLETIHCSGMASSSCWQHGRNAQGL